MASFPLASELALVLADEFDEAAPFPNVLLTRMGVSYFTRENPLDCSDILQTVFIVYSLIGDVLRSAQGLLFLTVSVSVFVVLWKQVCDLLF